MDITISILNAECFNSHIRNAYLVERFVHHGVVALLAEVVEILAREVDPLGAARDRIITHSDIFNRHSAILEDAMLGEFHSCFATDVRFTQPLTSGQGDNLSL